MELNKQQEDAVKNSYDKDTVLIAAAGSGKTRVLTERVAYIIKEGMATPDEILVLTFTNKAANEMKGRIEKECGKLADLTCGTFHSVFLHLLRRKLHLLGCEKFDITEPYAQRKIIMNLLREARIQYEKDDISKYLSTISSFKSELINPTQACNMAKSKDQKFIANLYTLYQNYCWKNRLLDFDDILVYSYVLLYKKDVVRNYLQKKYKYILVDEAQDCNNAQMTLLTLLKNDNNIMLIGDDWQAIYEFRGARPDFIVNNEKTLPGSKVMFLENNYRSTKNIINASNSIIKNNTDQIKKKVKAVNPDGDKVKLTCYQDSDTEVHLIVSKIYRLVKNNKCNYEDIAILYRTNYLSRAFEEELSSLNIPYTITGGLKFMERKEIKDITCFYKLKHNPYDVDSFKRILDQIRGVGKQSIEEIIYAAKQNNLNYIEVLSKVKTNRTTVLPSIYNILTQELSIYKFAQQIIKVMGMIEKYQKQDTEEAEERINNIGEFINIANSNNDLSLSDFIDVIALSSSNEEENNNTVKLMTIHSSKGLEFKHVFLIALENNILPHSMAKREEDVASERRLTYVAMTRAKTNLYLSYTKKRTLFGNTKTCEPSIFVYELDKKYIDKRIS